MVAVFASEPSSLSQSGHDSTKRRKRGLVLSSQGLQRLQSVIGQSPQSDRPFTLQELSDRTQLSPNTIARVQSRKAPVDRSTLSILFQAFDLTLRLEDCAQSDEPEFSDRAVIPSGQLWLESPFYLERAGLDADCYQALLNPGALIWLRAPSQFGKTSLVARLLHQAELSGCTTQHLSLQLADRAVFSDLNSFVRWFSTIVTHGFKLSMPHQWDWNDWLGSSYNCTRYFEEHVLSQIETPIVLAIDEASVLFNYPHVAADFLAMLRAWHEQARYGNAKSQLWQKLRLVLVQATDATIEGVLHPVQAGLEFELPPFTVEQISALAQRYGIENPDVCATVFSTLLGGHPYLVQSGLHHLKHQSLSIEQFTVMAPNFYRNHLRNLFVLLQSYAGVIADLKQVVLTRSPIEINEMIAIQLKNLGLVNFDGRKVFPSCELYRQYFALVLSKS